MNDPLADAILHAFPAGDQLRMEPGTVTSDSPCEVLLDSESTAAPATKPANYAPVALDRVQVLIQGADRVVLFKI